MNFIVFSIALIPSIVFGPGNRESAHSDNEHMDIGDILPATLIYGLTAIEYCNLNR